MYVKNAFFTDYGLKLTNIVHPVCLPYAANSKDRTDKEASVAGFATGDIYESTSTTLKVADMLVFSQDECNDNLQTELNKSEECK